MPPQYPTNPIKTKATEMNGLLYNHCKSPEAIGCVGRLGSLGKLATGTRIIKYSVEEDELVRTDKGFCIECGPGEVGQLVILIRDNEMSRFQGYSDKKATEKKIARNVFKQGDQYFCSGDLLSRDEKGYYRFVDRIGDTFRWKGENCSTMEVSEVVSSFPGILEANVYGVLVPNNADGRAPCAAISCEDESKMDFSKLLAHLKKNLPSYSVPLFLRMTPKIDVTATFKHQKVELRNQGIDISLIKDPMYYLQDGKTYVPLDNQAYAKICAPFAKL
jgi:fatty-acyl-CoA synthase